MQGAALWGVGITAIGGIGGTLAGATASLNSPQSFNQTLFGCGFGTALAAIVAVVLIVQRAQSTR